MDAYFDDEIFFPLSGIQHMAFCERQWALIHIERQWVENKYTVEGKHFHNRTDDPFESESRGDLYISRMEPIISHSLKLQGVADVVEYWRVKEGGIIIEGKPGTWYPRPVEYKLGKPKPNDCDEVQLCAQAMCLEDMLGIIILEGDLFYGKTCRRQKISFSKELRDRVYLLVEKMKYFYTISYTPEAKNDAHCQLCSLKDICLPRLTQRKRSVGAYIDVCLKEGDW